MSFAKKLGSVVCPAILIFSVLLQAQPADSSFDEFRGKEPDEIVKLVEKEYWWENTKPRVDSYLKSLPKDKRDTILMQAAMRLIAAPSVESQTFLFGFLNEWRDEDVLRDFLPNILNIYEHAPTKRTRDAAGLAYLALSDQASDQMISEFLERQSQDDPTSRKFFVELCPQFHPQTFRLVDQLRQEPKRRNALDYVIPDMASVGFRPAVEASAHIALDENEHPYIRDAALKSVFTAYKSDSAFEAQALKLLPIWIDKALNGDKKYAEFLFGLSPLKSTIYPILEHTILNETSDSRRIRAADIYLVMKLGPIEPQFLEKIEEDIRSLQRPLTTDDFPSGGGFFEIEEIIREAYPELQAVTLESLLYFATHEGRFQDDAQRRLLREYPEEGEAYFSAIYRKEIARSDVGFLTRSTNIDIYLPQYSKRLDALALNDLRHADEPTKGWAAAILAKAPGMTGRQEALDYWIDQALAEYTAENKSRRWYAPGVIRILLSTRHELREHAIDRLNKHPGEGSYRNWHIRAIAEPRLTDEVIEYFLNNGFDESPENARRPHKEGTTGRLLLGMEIPDERLLAFFDSKTAGADHDEVLRLFLAMGEFRLDFAETLLPRAIHAMAFHDHDDFEPGRTKRLMKLVSMIPIEGRGAFQEIQYSGQRNENIELFEAASQSAGASEAARRSIDVFFNRSHTAVRTTAYAVPMALLHAAAKDPSLIQVLNERFDRLYQEAQVSNESENTTNLENAALALAGVATQESISALAWLNEYSRSVEDKRHRRELVKAIEYAQEGLTPELQQKFGDEVLRRHLLQAQGNPKEIVLALVDTIDKWSSEENQTPAKNRYHDSRSWEYAMESLESLFLIASAQTHDEASRLVQARSQEKLDELTRELFARSKAGEPIICDPSEGPFWDIQELRREVFDAAIPENPPELYGDQFYLIMSQIVEADESFPTSLRSSLRAEIPALKTRIAMRLEKLAELREFKRPSGVEDSLMNTYAFATSILAHPNPPEGAIYQLRGLVKRSIDPLDLPYTPLPIAPSGNRRRSAARAVPVHLALYLRDTDERLTQEHRANLIAALINYRDNMGSLLSHLNRPGTHVGPDALAPYYYYSTIPYATSAIRILQNEPETTEQERALLGELAEIYHDAILGLLRIRPKEYVQDMKPGHLFDIDETSASKGLPNYVNPLLGLALLPLYDENSTGIVVP